MFAEPEALDLVRVQTLLRDRWGIVPSSLEHQPVGFGTYHYLATTGDRGRWFVNVDDLSQKGWFASDADSAFEWLGRSFGAAARLAGEEGMDFILAARPDHEGHVLTRVDDRYAMSVVPYIDGASPQFGEFASDEDRREVLAMLGRLHAATGRAAIGDIARSDLGVPMRDAFLAALGELDRPWDGGPFSEACRELLTERREAVVGLFDRYDALAHRTRRSGWVVTHGEPHAANTLRALSGELFLIDWDTCMIAPRERDLWQVGPCAHDGWKGYVEAGGTADLDEAALDLHRLWWTLAEITGYTAALRAPHVDDANTRAMLHWFRHYVP